MKTYEIPVDFRIATTLEVQADSLKEAIAKAGDQFRALRYEEVLELIQPENIVKHSLFIDPLEAEEMNPKPTYVVRLVRTMEVEVEVEAESNSEAEQAALNKYEENDILPDEWEETDLEVQEVEVQNT